MLAMCMLLAAILSGCASQNETDERLGTDSLAGLAEATVGDTMEAPRFKVVFGSDDPFVLETGKETPEQDDEPLDISGLLEDTDRNYNVPTGGGSKSGEDEIPDTNPDIPEEPGRYVMGQVITTTVVVTDGSGYPIRNAKVSIDREVNGKTEHQEKTTDANGKANFKLVTDVIELGVSGSGYVSYYEEFTLTPIDTELRVCLADGDKVRRILDNAALHPYHTNYKELEEYLDVLFAKLFTPGMGTYDKVLACYDYVIQHTDYKQPKHWISQAAYWPCAHQSFLENIGVCNCYSAMFTVMMRRIGLDCFIVTGYTTSIKGGYTSHDWTTICIDGKYYIFDCQVEDAIADRTSSKEVRYLRFCIEEPYAKYKYSSSKSREYCIKKFNEYLLANGYFVD